MSATLPREQAIDNLSRWTYDVSEGKGRKHPMWIVVFYRDGLVIHSMRVGGPDKKRVKASAVSWAAGSPIFRKKGKYQIQIRQLEEDEY